jgi:flagellar biosynthetic protein FliP
MSKKPFIAALGLGVALTTLVSAAALAQSPMDLPLLKLQSAPGGGQTLSLTLQTLVLMTVLTLLPSLLLVMTSFTFRTFSVPLYLSRVSV